MNVTVQSNIGFIYEMAERMGVMFYLVRPTIYEDVHRVPNFMHRVSLKCASKASLFRWLLCTALTTHSPMKPLQ